MNIIKRLKEQKIAYQPLLRKDVAVMLGIAAPNLTNDCKLLKMARPARCCGMSLADLYRVWALRVLMVERPDCDRRHLAQLVLVPATKLEKFMASIGYAMPKFVEAYRFYLENGVCIKPEGFNRKLPENFRGALQKKRWRFGHYVRREAVAKYLGISGASVSNYLRVLGIEKGESITKSIFKQLVQMRTIAYEWQQEFKALSEYDKKLIKKHKKTYKIARYHQSFYKRMTLANAKALLTKDGAFLKILTQEYERLEAVVASNLSNIDAVFSELTQIAS